MDSSSLKAESRTDKGSAAARRMRHAGLIPANLYKDGSESVSLQLNEHEVETCCVIMWAKAS